MRAAQDRWLPRSALADLADIPATSRWIRVGDLRLHALDYGGPGIPVVVLPGITMPAVGMDFLARGLLGTWRPVVVDMRGRGLSDSADSYTLLDYAQDAEAVVSGLGLRRPILLGHSMGARVAALAAARARTELAGTVIVDPPLSGPARGPYPTPLSSFELQLAAAYRGTTAAEVAAAWPRWPERELQLRARWLSSCDRAAVTATHAAFESESFFDAWPAVPWPTTLIRGADSPVVDDAGLREALELNPAAAHADVPDAGHMVFWDNPREALAATWDALSRCV